MKVFLCISFIFLNILDVMTTNKVLELGGFEANPLVRLLMRFHLFVPLKIVVTAYVAVIIVFSNSPDSLYLALFVCAFYALLVANNLFQIRRGLKWSRDGES